MKHPGGPAIQILGQQESHRSLQLEVKESGGREGGRDTYYESGIGQVLMNPTVREDWGGASVSEHWSSQRASSRGKVSEQGLLQHRAQQVLSKTQARNRAICPAHSLLTDLGPTHRLCYPFSVLLMQGKDTNCLGPAYSSGKQPVVARMEVKEPTLQALPASEQVHSPWSCPSVPPGTEV